MLLQQPEPASAVTAYGGQVTVLRCQERLHLHCLLLMQSCQRLELDLTAAAGGKSWWQQLDRDSWGNFGPLQAAWLCWSLLSCIRAAPAGLALHRPSVVPRNGAPRAHLQQPYYQGALPAAAAAAAAAACPGLLPARFHQCLLAASACV